MAQPGYYANPPPPQGYQQPVNYPPPPANYPPPPNYPPQNSYYPQPEPYPGNPSAQQPMAQGPPPPNYIYPPGPDPHHKEGYEHPDGHDKNGMPLAPPPATVLAVGVVTEKKMKTCLHCNREFSEHTKRSGIPICTLILIILLSCFVFLFLLLFICLCKQYKVCPHCGQFSKHGDSNKKGICLC